MDGIQHTHFYIGLTPSGNPETLAEGLNQGEKFVYNDGKRVAYLTLTAQEVLPTGNILLSGNVDPPADTESVILLRYALSQLADGIINVVVVTY